MELTRRKKKIAVSAGISTEQQQYPHDLSLYVLPPTSVISLAEFEEIAVDRLEALRILEMVSLRGLKNIEDMKNVFVSELNKAGLKYFAKLLQDKGSNKDQNVDIQARRKDHISHFILRLCYCQTEELRRWFAKQEIELFRLRFMTLSLNGIKDFLKINNFDYSPISAEEKNELKARLYESTPMKTPLMIDSYDFYRVPFQLIPNLIQNRKCFLKKGYGYIPHTELISVVTGIYRAHIHEALVRTMRMLPLMMDDERVSSFVKNLHHSYIGKEDFSLPKDSIDIKSLDNLSRRSFPLCMRQLHMNLRANHHLRHGGRQQYGLFLKGIGVTLEDAMRFWREEFTKLMDSDKFEKQYAYNIRHNYGKEGKQTSYSAYSCMKIIMSSISAGDAHGCPFRHNDFDIVKQQMSVNNISQAGIKEVEDLVKGKHYQLACGKFFELSHGVLPETGGINHPNQYFKSSINILSEKQEASSNLMKPPTGPTVKRAPLGPAATQNNGKSQEDDLWAGDFDVSNIPGFE